MIHRTFLSTRVCAHARVSRYRDLVYMLWALAVGARRIAMSAVTKKPEVVFILGGPGAGKGTLCRYIVERYGYVHLSAGDLLREERVKPGSQYGELIETHIRNGTIVPVEITCSLLDRAMRVSDNPYNRFLIDGFPRNQDNLDGWNKVYILLLRFRANARCVFLSAFYSLVESNRAESRNIVVELLFVQL